MLTQFTLFRKSCRTPSCAMADATVRKLAKLPYRTQRAGKVYGFFVDFRLNYFP
jgi:hypothetical protein